MKINKMTPDRIDRKILNLLLQDSRSSYRDIAKKVDVSVVTVMNRIKRLEADGIIRQYTAFLDYDKIGYDITVIVELRVEKGRLFQVEKRLAGIPNVVAVYDITGHFDVLVIAKFRNRKSLDVFLKQIQSYDFVQRTETKLVLNIMKERFLDI
ncbi:Lrp/AsnC family transcriptional regulator [Candidatus Woesearchaeota archaeon]|nr:Lrp/AsnC family transcriptional regulator [Candidatus Woesearchaeota archaeon]